jgi:hypothetical protein
MTGFSAALAGSVGRDAEPGLLVRAAVADV